MNPDYTEYKDDEEEDPKENERCRRRIMEAAKLLGLFDDDMFDEDDFPED